jgi:cyclopropane-fatty-acyl-phospholipid synthase
MLARRIMRGALARLHEGELTLVEGGTTTLHGPGGTPGATITVHDDRLWSAVLRRGSVGLGQAYANGWFDSDDLASLVHLAVANLEPIQRPRDRLADALAPVHDLLPSRSRGRETDRAHVAAHYDLSNRFFSLMLDPTMTYSCALFDDPAASLDAAQRAKFARICELLDLTADDQLFEIGTGWGGFALHAASTLGCHVTTTTISVSQWEHTRRRVAELGLEDRIDVLALDYRDVGGTYDKVVSIEMIEAVDWRDHAAFFSTVAERLRPGGRATLQAIVIDDRSYERAKRHTDFIKAAIFPGGCLPSISSIIRAARDTGRLLPVGVHRIGQHYPETLRRWQQNVDVHRDEIVRLGFDDRFLRTWDFYLQYCIGSFEAHHIDDVHVVLEKE